MRSTARATFDLLDAAADVFAGDAESRARVDALARRSEEPLRVAVAGMTGSGKSTMLHALIGADLAFAAGPWPQSITTYRFGPVPRVRRHPASGVPVELTLERRGDRVRVLPDESGIVAGDDDRLEVEWPAPLLGSLTLIDLPGLASLRADDSARAAAFLAPERDVPEVDAIVYVLRRLHATDVTFLRSLHERAGQYGVIDTVAVLSRADEIGAGRVDSLLSAREIAERYRGDEVLRSVASGIVPVAGLLARTARTLGPAEFRALSALASMDTTARERLLVSADRFTRSDDTVPVPADERAALLRRMGLFGVRLSVDLLRTGIVGAAQLASELAERSGVDDLLELVGECMLDRAELLRARTAVLGVRSLLAARPPRHPERVQAAMELVESGAHGFRELRLLADLRNGRLVVPPGTGREIERILGGRGTDVASRLSLPKSADADEMRAKALAGVRRWRRMAANPLIDRSTVAVCDAVVRSCEGMLQALPRVSGGRQLSRLTAAPEEPVGAG